MMTSRERVRRTLAHQAPDRVPIYDSFWMETERDFRERLGCPLPPQPDSKFAWGDSATAAKTRTLWEIFDMDLIQVGWPDYRLRLEPATVLEETDEWVLQRDANFAVLRWWKKRMGTPEHIRYEIDTPEKWAQVKPLLTAAPQRVRWDEFEPLYRRARAADRYVCYAATEVIESVKDILGHEIMLKAMIKQPEWIHDVFDTYSRLQVEMFELVEAAGMVCDGAFIYADIAYKNGPFMSPRHYREFVQPYHKRFFDAFHRRGMPVMVHSDGDIRPLLPAFLEIGVAAINPLEAKAGMDVRELAPQYGDRLGFVGNIDVRVMATNDRAQIEQELRQKLAAAMPYHAYIYHSDHSVPPGMKLETYQWLLERVRQLGRYD